MSCPAYDHFIRLRELSNISRPNESSVIRFRNVTSTNKSPTYNRRRLTTRLTRSAVKMTPRQTRRTKRTTGRRNYIREFPVDHKSGPFTYARYFTPIFAEVYIRHRRFVTAQTYWRDAAIPTAKLSGRNNYAADARANRIRHRRGTAR